MTGINAAIVGTGFMGPVHAEALARIGITVCGILGSSPEKSELAKKAMGLPRAFADFEEILADTSVDAVHLCTPNLLHYDHAKRALEAGKHVMCEKPLAMTSLETASLMEIAAKSGCAAAVCYNLRFYPLHFHAQSLVRGGKLGRLFHVNGSYAQDWLLYETDYNWRLNAAESGALRAVADIGTHWMDLVEMITGQKISSVFADLQTFFPTRKRPTGDVTTFSGGPAGAAGVEDVAIDTEDYGNIMFRMSGGAVGSLYVSQLAAGRKNALRYEIAGADGALAWDGESPNELWLGHRDKPNEILLKDPGLLDAPARPYASYPGGHAEGYPDTFKQCFKAFYDYIQNGVDPAFPGFDAGHRQVKLCEAILSSSRQEKWVEVED
ncbi:dehydrogenase [Kordiimonas sediminis]|uniref:Dehydrogenase n=1 Tax=Kordiimonas sediminis TaxID=1735581 RepID=A0A919AMQ2_9PROT|nr:Gfo/Idh/MocA family oxidoreductase [Kordiimonas sediminis]GHF13387.1 dehydrogenase [Kordiimonas sediminis]